MLNQKFLANIIFFIILALAPKAKSQIIDNSDYPIENKVFSVLAVNIIFNNKIISKDSNIECKIEFIDDYNQKVLVSFDEKSNFITLESSPGKVFIRSLKCSNHSIPLIFGKSRFKTINDYGFVAFKDFINYGGHITIDYHSSYFKILDLFNLSSMFIDKDGVISLTIDDKINEAIGFINYKFKNLNRLQITKSLMNDNLYLKPNENPVPYDISNPTNTPPNNTQDNNPKINIPTPPPPISINSGKNITKSTTPQHQYLAPYYSEFYAPIYNPYFSVAPNNLIINTGSSDLQDPIIENPH